MPSGVLLFFILAIITLITLTPLCHAQQQQQEEAELPLMKEASNHPVLRRVVVVGGGLAGLSAAISAAQRGASVIVTEKFKTIGGNSAKATSGINGCLTPLQVSQHVNDSVELFKGDTVKSGGKGTALDERLVDTLVNQSASGIDWLQQQTGLDLSVLCQLGGHSAKRTHRLPDTPDGRPTPVGFSIMKRLREKIDNDLSDKVTIMTNTQVTGLVSKSNVGPDQIQRTRVLGVKFRTVDAVTPEGAEEKGGRDEIITADAVILATGGFSNDHSENSLLKEYAPDLVKVPTTNGAFATGDGAKMAREIGATLQDMDKIQLHPTGFIDPANPKAPTKFLGPEALRGSGGVLLSPATGERFVDELGLRSHVSAAIKVLGNDFPTSGGLPFAFIVLNKHAAQLFGPAQLSFYRDTAKLLRPAENIDDLAKVMLEMSGAAASNSPEPPTHASLVAGIKETFADYVAAMSSGRCNVTGKSVFPCQFAGDDSDGPFVVGVITPSIHYTMGGVAISPAAEVQVVDHGSDSTGMGADHHHPESNLQLGRHRPIRGLFAAGEVTSGVHGANRLGGNSLLECVVFGRIAGAKAAAPEKEEEQGASNDEFA